MRSICESFEETIWEYARSGAELPTEAQAHVDHCHLCRQTLREAQQIMSAVLEADCVPYAPDCRQAVMARIAPPARAPRLTWAYAFAGVAFAAISALAIVNVYTYNSPVMPVAKVVAPQSAARPAIDNARVILRQELPKPYRRIAKLRIPSLAKPFRVPVVHRNLKPAPEAPYMVAKLPDPPRGTIVKYLGYSAVKEKAETPASFTVHYNSFEMDGAPAVSANDDKLSFSVDAADSKSSFAPSAVVAKKDTESTIAYGNSIVAELDATTAEGYAAAPIDGNIFRTGSRQPERALTWTKANSTTKPVALAVVHWSAPAEEPAGSYSYSYSDTDTQTGEVTSCEVKRTGDTVDIRIESKPEAKHPSERGSIDYATLAKI